MQELRDKINEKIKTLKEEFYSYYTREEMDEDDNITKDQIRKEIELSEWVIEESYMVKQS